ncbi:NAD(P)-binding protein [Aspergillus alliaceus]|uniref:NAD(P)-binding protein n=1 Tax=Petromyces alliaceus TaxID=209559 RepID=A0A5N7BUB9_PETAA|nr:NAD(P)-binding protein [Aspergillus alliaceus]
MRMWFYLCRGGRKGPTIIHHSSMAVCTCTPARAAADVSHTVSMPLASEPLNAGYKVIGTTRDVSKAEAAYPDFSAKGGVWIGLDAAQINAYDQLAKYFKELNVDVLVKNAGYPFIGGVEDTSEIEVRDEREVNFYGTLRAVRACLPVTRARGSEHIILISHGARYVYVPMFPSFLDIKFAIEAVHESLSPEIKTLDVKVLIEEPGSFRTPFSSRIGTTVKQMVAGSRQLTSIPDYVKEVPDKAAQVIVKATVTGYGYLRMPLGKGCVRDLEAARPIATAADVD